jgi:hypothetical protein
VEGGRLFFRGRRWEEGLGVGGEVVAAVWGIEAFWKYYNLSTSLGSFEHFISGMEKILGFVCACSYASVSSEGEETEKSSIPLANWTSASLTGFLSRVDIAAVAILELKGLYTGLKIEEAVLIVRSVLYIFGHS